MAMVLHPWYKSVKLPPMSASVKFRLPIFVMIFLALFLSGCRRNLMRVSTNPGGATVYVQGKVVRLEDSDRPLARKIDEKIKREKDLNEDETEFHKDRHRLQLTPVEYEFESIACGYSIYCMKKGYRPAYHVEYIKPRWWEYPPFDFIVDCLPFTIEDLREVNINLQPEHSIPGTPGNGP